MARHTAMPSRPIQPAQLAPAQKREAISRLRKRLQELEAFDPNSVDGALDPRVVALSQALDRTLVYIFGAATVDYDRYKDISALGTVLYAGGETPIATRRRYLEEDKSKAIAVIKGIITGFQEDLDEFGTDERDAAVSDSGASPNKIFVVHGHDEGALQAVARFLDLIGLKAIILREQPDQGRTIIEKFEACAREVGFAVVLLTPDDLGGTAVATAQAARARQNVIFELGYFVGSLGRGRACLLRKGDVEIPSDLFGVIYSDFDHPAESWKVKLARELRAANFEFDSAKVLA
jgi:predicted nucleotide-binding protein